MENIRNWKLKQILDKIEVIHPHSIEFRNELVKEKKIPRNDNVSGLHRQETYLDWSKFNDYHSFCFDNESEEDIIRTNLVNSKLGEQMNIIMLYGWGEPVVKIPIALFIEDWEGFIRSALWETLIFSEDLELLMEVTRDYHIHSNFLIYNPPPLSLASSLRRK